MNKQMNYRKRGPGSKKAKKKKLRHVAADTTILVLFGVGGVFFALYYTKWKFFIKENSPVNLHHTDKL